VCLARVQFFFKSKFASNLNFIHTADATNEKLQPLLPSQFQQRPAQLKDLINELEWCYPTPQRDGGAELH